MRRSTSATGRPSRPGRSSARRCAPGSSASSTGPTPRRVRASPASTCAPASAPRPARCSPASREVDGLDDRALLADLAARGRGRRRGRRPGRWRCPTPVPAVTRCGWRSAAPRRRSTTPAPSPTVEAAFAELPADLRATLGPRLIGRMLDAARPAEARRLLDTSVRNGDAPDAGAAARRGAHARRRGRGRGGGARARRARRGPRPGRRWRRWCGRCGWRSTPGCRCPRTR